MAIEMVRIPSETPNINNIDDFVGLRYAFGNQNGYIKDKGNECSYTVSGSNFKINSGRLVLQGVECDIDANGVEIAIESIAAKQYNTIYLQINLALNETKILVQSDATTYPTISTGDDLTENTTGVARLALYNFDATSGVISNVQKIVKGIEYYNSALDGYDASKGTVETRLEPLNNYDTTKGTIEERLTKLGFKQGTIVRTDTVVPAGSSGTVYRQGNYVIGEFHFSTIFAVEYGQWVIGTIPVGFRPKSEIQIYNLGDTTNFTSSLIINTSGEIVLKNSQTMILGSIHFGYETFPAE